MPMERARYQFWDMGLVLRQIGKNKENIECSNMWTDIARLKKI